MLENRISWRIAWLWGQPCSINNKGGGAWRPSRPVTQCRQFQEEAKDASVSECTWTLSALEALCNALYKFKTYLLTQRPPNYIGTTRTHPARETTTRFCRVYKLDVGNFSAWSTTNGMLSRDPFAVANVFCLCTRLQTEQSFWHMWYR